MNKSTRPNTTGEQRPVRVTTLLNAAATLGAAVLAVAMYGPKIPPMAGD